MIAKMRSALGWICRRFVGLGATPLRSRRSLARVSSGFDALEIRQVLSTATIAPTFIPAGQISPTATPNASVAPAVYYGQPAVQVPTVVSASALVPVYQSGLAVVPGPAGGFSLNDTDAGYVQSLYHDVLGRVGSADEVSSWLGKIGSGMTIQQVAEGFVDSVEHRQDEVESYYEEFLHRTTDAGAATWVNAMLAGASEEDVAEAILDSPEYQAAHPDATGFIQNLYVDVLGRPADTAGVAVWQAALASGQARSAVVSDFVNSTEAVDQAVESIYGSLLHRQPEALISDQWADMLEAPNASVSDVAVGILSSPEFIRDSEQA